MTQGLFPLTSVDSLPNVQVAFPGEVWTNRTASGTITPGDCVVPANSGGKLVMKKAAAGDSASVQYGIALNPIQVPDTNAGSYYNNALGPNEIVNRSIATGSYVRVYYSGAFHLTKITARAWVPGELVGWAASGTPQTGKTGTGCWDISGAQTDIDNVFEVLEFRPLAGSTTVGILTVRSLRGQF